MKRILMFRRQELCYNSLNFFTERLAEAFSTLGIHVDFFEIREEGAIDFGDGDFLKKGNYDLALAFNAGGQHNSYISNGHNSFDEYGVPFVNYILDHPIVHYGNMTSTCSNYYVLCVDRGHADFIRSYCNDIRDAFFIPLGGIEPEREETPNRIPYSERPYALTFTGTYNDPRRIGEYIDSNYPTLLKELIWTYIDMMIDDRNLSLEQALKSALEATHIRDKADSTFQEWAIATEIAHQFIKAYNREEVLRYIISAGIPIHIWGDAWEQMEDVDEGNVKLHGSVAYGDLPVIYAKSQLVANVMPYFKQGMHDRLPMAMLAGTAILSDHSTYTKEVFERDKAYPTGYFYDLRELDTLPDMINDIFYNSEEMERVAKEGYELAKQEFTWNRIAETIKTRIFS